jgi:predicted ATPase
LRDEPQRSYRQRRLHGIDVGARGEEAVLLLQRHWQKQVDFVQLPENSQEIVAWEKLLPVRMPLGEALNEALRWLGMQTLKVEEGFGVVRVDFVTLSNPKTWVTMADVGFGVSQVLPVLVLGLLSETDSILIFEQPEIHLHPRAQARLGELLVCLAKTGRRVLIETHSDHLINRLRRVVAEDLSDQLSDLVSIVFVTPPANGEGAYLSPLRVNEEGLIENWPEDFLAETASDARAIVKAGIRKRRMAKQSKGEGKS